MNVFAMPAYEVVKLTDGMDVLRSLFPEGEANALNFVMFSTSGTHGSYLTIEEVAASLGSDEPSKLTVLVIQPRVVRLLYGEIEITADDVPYLQNLRESSKRVFAGQ
ncbi:hypothetical protein [Mesorhizobium sp. B2-1-3A]|uniref:hypothetical protein n=1 Tax=Mesorhizobium sp. B2-1-3A TaxID=2589971 RepID=UPI0011298AD6|nr:hypothetical protein [Mesorhizobium sp. B2-1-3A]TPM89876.1 hypothetical protein FJ977_35465 [Mesorhizobium sp. B2-1-3A]